MQAFLIDLLRARPDLAGTITDLVERDMRRGQARTAARAAIRHYTAGRDRDQAEQFRPFAA